MNRIVFLAWYYDCVWTFWQVPRYLFFNWVFRANVLPAYITSLRYIWIWEVPQFFTHCIVIVVLGFVWLGELSWTWTVCQAGLYDSVEIVQPVLFFKFFLQTVPTCQNLYKNSFTYHSLKEDKTLPFTECLEFIGKPQNPNLAQKSCRK